MDTNQSSKITLGIVDIEKKREGKTTLENGKGGLDLPYINFKMETIYMFSFEIECLKKLAINRNRTDATEGIKTDKLIALVT